LTLNIGQLTGTGAGVTNISSISSSSANSNFFSVSTNGVDLVDIPTNTARFTSYHGFSGTYFGDLSNATNSGLLSAAYIGTDSTGKMIVKSASGGIQVNTNGTLLLSGATTLNVTSSGGAVITGTQSGSTATVNVDTSGIGAGTSSTQYIGYPFEFINTVARGGGSNYQLPLGTFNGALLYSPSNILSSYVISPLGHGVVFTNLTFGVIGTNGVAGMGNYGTNMLIYFWTNGVVSNITGTYTNVAGGTTNLTATCAVTNLSTIGITFNPNATIPANIYGGGALQGYAW
jgi:hypothetical protein